MDLILAGLQSKNCLVYVDDILVIRKTFDEHLDNLGLIFDHLKEAGIKLKPSKCFIRQKQLTHLGPDGIATIQPKQRK